MSIAMNECIQDWVIYMPKKEVKKEENAVFIVFVAVGAFHK